MKLICGRTTFIPGFCALLLYDNGIQRVAAATDQPLHRVTNGYAEEFSPHPKVDCYAVVPATSNTVGKLALGLADNQALTQVCEAIGLDAVPVVVFPRINAAHARHPSWGRHIAALTQAGVHLVMGEDVWPLQEPRSTLDKELPWDAIINAIVSSVRP